MSGSRKVVKAQQLFSALNQTGDGMSGGMTDDYTNQMMAAAAAAPGLQNISASDQAYMKTEQPEYKPVTLHQSGLPREEPNCTSVVDQRGEFRMVRMSDALPMLSRARADIPGPLLELHKRLDAKRQSVIGLANNNPEVIELLDNVHHGKNTLMNSLH